VTRRERRLQPEVERQIIQLPQHPVDGAEILLLPLENLPFL